MDSKFLRSNCGAYELLFWNIPEMVQDKNGATNTRDIGWASAKCKIQYGSMGIFPEGEDFTHVNSVTLTNDGRYLIDGDDWGLVNVFNYPAPYGSKSQALSLRYVYNVGVIQSMR